MTRVFLCYEDGKLEVLTDDKPSAERWRRDGEQRNYTDFIVRNKEEFEQWKDGQVISRIYVDGQGWQ